MGKDLGIFLIKWDEIIGGTVYLKYPPDLEIPENVVQQIQISHDFIESQITIKEKDWNSISYYNEDKQIITVLILDKYADSSDYMGLLEEFNKALDQDATDEELLDHMEKILSTEVFRTRDEVIAKLSNEVAELKMREYDLDRKFEKIINIDAIGVKGKIIALLALKDHLTYEEMRKGINTSKRWLETVLNTLSKNDIIGYNSEKRTYYLKF